MTTSSQSVAEIASPDLHPPRPFYARSTVLGKPNISATIATPVPTGPNALRIMEGMLAILRSGGLPDRVTALADDLIATYTLALALEAGTWAAVALTGPLTAGGGEERFEFALEVLVAGVERVSDTPSGDVAPIRFQTSSNSGDRWWARRKNRRGQQRESPHGGRRVAGVSSRTA